MVEMGEGRPIAVMTGRGHSVEVWKGGDRPIAVKEGEGRSIAGGAPQTFRFMNVWIYRSVDPQIHRSVDPWTCAVTI